MVNTRQNHSISDTGRDMPVRDVRLEDSSSRNHRRERSDKCGMENESDFEPLVRRTLRPRWRSEVRPRFPSKYRTMERVSRHPARACRMRIVPQRMDTDDDMGDDSCGPYNDDDDEPIFSPIRSPRKLRRMTRGARRAEISRLVEDEDRGRDVSRPGSSKMTNGVKEEEEEEEEADNEGEGVRRSKRQRKLIYDNFNQSWIVGTQTVLRGYPDMYKTRQRAADPDATSNSNDEEGGDRDPTPPDNEVKPEENGEDEDMYTKVKRTRRSRIRYSPSAQLQSKPQLRERRQRVEDPAGSSESESGQSTDDARPRHMQRRVYHLRENKPAVERFQITDEPTRKSSRLLLCSVPRRAFQRKRRDSSSSDEGRFERKKALSMAKARSRCMPLNYKPSDAQAHQKTPVHSSKPVAGGIGPKGPADVDPMTIDTSVTFEKVGGLQEHLRCLKEMVVFPMLYREIFENFNVQPPKGVLFHGPPGTGKTLVARALANECSQGERKLAFFMRKGADCLSKWVGESERQLRLLFEQAYQMRPSIIFFDEIDGLAPVRSSKQDQIHASIVSTLLALLDGLDDRGEIIVIGATNRIDAIDPALRRPGRFDRELYFPLPGKKERIEIMKIHTKSWKNPPPQDVVDTLADGSVGYCGSDLRLLCSEAVVGALHRRYPQIYRTNKKLLLQPDEVKVQKDDFFHAYSKIVPASCRVNPCPRVRLSPVVAPLLKVQFNIATETVKRVFPHAALSSIHDRLTRSVYKPRFLLCGANSQYGQTSHLSPALMDLMEHIPVHILGLDSLLDTTNRSPEEAVIQIVREASRNPPSILYMPGIDTWWNLLPPTTHRILLDRVAQIPANAAVLLLGTAHTAYFKLDARIQTLFKYDHQDMRVPTEAERSAFFQQILREEPKKNPLPPPVPEEDWETLPLAPPPKPPPPSKKELEELHNLEEQRLRELRLFLRDICAKLARNRQFFMFTKPVDIKEVPDYLNIIQRPMDLETMMTNIDLHIYNSAQEFLTDIDLIVSNALEYNPDRDPEDKLIRHRACSLRDTAYTLIKAEMDTDFEEECRKISKKRKDTKNKEKKTEAGTGPTDKEQMPVCNGSLEAVNSTASGEEARRRRLSAQGVKPSSSLFSADRIRRRKSKWARGLLNKKAKGKGGKDGEGGTPASGESTSQDAYSNCVSNTETSGKHRASSPIERELPKRSKPTPTSPVAAVNGELEPNPHGSGSSLASSEELTPRKKAKREKFVRQLELNATPGVIVAEDQLKSLHTRLVHLSGGWTVERLLDCHALIRRIVENYADRYDRLHLAQDLEDAVKEFSKSSVREDCN